MDGITYYRFLFARRLFQIGIITLFFAGNAFGWKIMRGNLSSSRLFDEIPLADPFAVLQIFASGSLVAGQAVLGAVIVLLFFGVLGGRTFCSWVCPVNMVTDFSNWLRKLMKIDSSVSSLQLSRNMRYWFIAVSLILSLFLGVAAFEQISPIGTLHRGIIFGMGTGWAVIAAVFFFDLFVLRNGFCGHVCPVGGFYSIVGRYSLVRVRHSSARCTLCMRCLEICPEQQVLPMVGKTDSMVLSGECTNCGRCIERCHENAMKFGLRFFDKKKL